MSFLTRPKNAGTTKEQSVRQEKDLAKRLGGFTTPGSGSGGAKGDVHTRAREMVEAKTTSKRQFILKLADLDKLSTEAQASGKRPVFIIEFDNRNRSVFTSSEWVLLPADDYEDLTKHRRG